MVKRVCLVSSGTGGHLLPAVMLAHALRDSGDEPILLTEGRRPEAVLLERYPCRSESLPFGRGRLGMPVHLLGATMRARRFLQREQVDVVVGTGGRTTVPVGLAAKSLGLPVALMEQNAVPGRANRLLFPLAERIYLGLPTESAPRRSVVTGTPLRPEVGHISRSDARRSLGFHDDAPVVFVTGGSQGAQALNETVPAALCSLRQPLQVSHLCGHGRDEAVRMAYAEGVDHGVAALVRSHAFDVATQYAAADLVICRGGGGTVAELAQAGRAAIIVPYPHHKDRQQFFNGKLLQEVGAAVVVEQPDLTVSSLTSLLKGLMHGDRLQKMGERARELAHANPCGQIVEDLHQLQ